MTASTDAIEQANRTDAAIRPESVLAAVADRVRRDAGAVAVADEGQEITYGQLWRAALHVRDVPRSSGVVPGDVVALAAPRGADLAAAVYGTWLAGAA